MDVTMEDFLSLIQEGTVQDYFDAFESLLNKVRVSEELSEDYVVYCFIMGLKPEIGEVLKPHHNIDRSLKLGDAILRAEMQELILKLDSINWNQYRITKFDDSSETIEVSDSILQQEDNSMVILDVENGDDVKKYNNDKDRTVINQEKMGVVSQDQGIELVVPMVFDEMPSRFENEFDSLFQDCIIQDPCDGGDEKEGENYKESTIRFCDLERLKLSSSKKIQESPLNTKPKDLGIQVVRDSTYRLNESMFKSKRKELMFKSKRKGVRSWLVRWKWKNKIKYLTKLQTAKFVASLVDNVPQQEQAVNNLVQEAASGSVKASIREGSKKEEKEVEKEMGKNEKEKMIQGKEVKTRKGLVEDTKNISVGQDCEVGDPGLVIKQVWHVNFGVMTVDFFLSQNKLDIGSIQVAGFSTNCLQSNEAKYRKKGVRRWLIKWKWKEDLHYWNNNGKLHKDVIVL